MSAYLFMASDVPFEEVINEKIKYYSFQEARERGLLQEHDKNFPGWWEKLNDEQRLKEASVLHASDEGELFDLQITTSGKNGTACDAHGLFDVSGYTQKPYIADLEFHITDERAERLVAYIGKHLISAHELEIWQIWADDEGEQTVEKTKCKLFELTPSHIENIYNHQSLPVCLIIER